MTSVYGFFIGFVIDNLGVQRSLQLGAALSFFSRLLVALTRSRKVLLLIMYTTMPLGGSLSIPVMTIAIRRYTHENIDKNGINQRDMAYKGKRVLQHEERKGRAMTKVNLPWCVCACACVCVCVFGVRACACAWVRVHAPLYTNHVHINKCVAHSS